MCCRILCLSPFIFDLLPSLQILILYLITIGCNYDSFKGLSRQWSVSILICCLSCRGFRLLHATHLHVYISFACSDCDRLLYLSGYPAWAAASRRPAQPGCGCPFTERRYFSLLLWMGLYKIISLLRSHWLWFHGCIQHYCFTFFPSITVSNRRYSATQLFQNMAHHPVPLLGIYAGYCHLPCFLTRATVADNSSSCPFFIYAILDRYGI